MRLSPLECLRKEHALSRTTLDAITSRNGEAESCRGNRFNLRVHVTAAFPLGTQAQLASTSLDIALPNPPVFLLDRSRLTHLHPLAMASFLAWLFFAFAGIFVHPAFGSPVSRALRPRWSQDSSDCTSHDTRWETDLEVCSSDMCMPILECLLEFDGMGFCCDLLSQPSPSAPAPSNNAGGTCATVPLLRIDQF